MQFNSIERNTTTPAQSSASSSQQQSVHPAVVDEPISSPLVATHEVLQPLVPVVRVMDDIVAPLVNSPAPAKHKVTRTSCTPTRPSKSKLELIKSSTSQLQKTSNQQNSKVSKRTKVKAKPEQRKKAKSKTNTATADDSFEVERILACKKDGRGKPVQYLVKWKGYNASHNSYVDVKDMVGCDLIIAQYGRITNKRSRK